MGLPREHKEMKRNHTQFKYHLEKTRRKCQKKKKKKKNRERDRGNLIARTNNGSLKDSSVTSDLTRDT